MQQLTKYNRWLNEVSFSVYLALLVVTEEETCRRGSIFLQWIGYPLKEYIYPVLVAHHISLIGSHSVTLWLLLAVIVFILIRLLSRFAITTSFLKYVPGFVAVMGFPLLLLPPCNLTALHASTATWALLYLEVAAVAVCVFLYLSRRWPFGEALTLFLLAVHFCIWGWLTWQRIGNPFWAIYLLLGFCFALFWAVYLKQLENAQQLKGAATG